jgi:hypothetical protein
MVQSCGKRYELTVACTQIVLLKYYLEFGQGYSILTLADVTKQKQFLLIAIDVPVCLLHSTRFINY